MGGCYPCCRRREKKPAHCTVLLTPFLRSPTAQKTKNTKTGSEMQRDKEQVAAMMREKQKAGKTAPSHGGRSAAVLWYVNDLTIVGPPRTADERRAAEAAAGKQK